MNSNEIDINFKEFLDNHAQQQKNLFSGTLEKNYQYQSEHNPIFSSFIDEFPSHSADKDAIPLLPIEAFREAKVMAGLNSDYDLLFESSGTTGMRKSRHFVKEEKIYRSSLLEGFRHFYPLDEMVILAYTPGYADNPNSSLIWMLKELISQDQTGMSRFLPLEKEIPESLIMEITSSGKKVMLFGAAFGFLDMIERYPITLPADSLIMETGGMKTHRREVSRAELHQKLSDGFGLPLHQIHSEYGMTEMLSQAYCRDGLWFEPVPWLAVSIRNPENPLEVVPDGERGLLGIIDLANVHSCSFILTKDIGLRRADGAFQVLGRYRHSNLRGCNFLIDDE